MELEMDYLQWLRATNMELEMDYLQWLHLAYLVFTFLLILLLKIKPDWNICMWFGIVYLIITTVHIIILARFEKTLIDETPLSKQDPYSYILFVVSFAWAFLLLTYKGRCVEKNK